MNIQALFFSEKVSQALIAPQVRSRDCEPQVRQSAKVQFGDYQANGVMAVAKKLGMPPRQLAEQVLTASDPPYRQQKPKSLARALSTIFPSHPASHVDAALKSDRLGVSIHKRGDRPLPAPWNVAKEMHRWPPRSTITPDAAVRTLEFLGHKVIRANHVWRLGYPVRHR